MSLIRILILISFIIALVQSDHIFKEKSPKHESFYGFIKGKAADADHLHEITIAINQKNLEWLKSSLYDVSEMNSPNYGKHKTMQEIGEKTQNIEGTTAVLAWLNQNDVKVKSQTVFGDYITIEAKVSTLERMLNTKFNEYHKINDIRSVEGIETSEIDKLNHVVRANSYYIPEELNQHIHAIFKATGLPVPIRHHSKRNENKVNNKNNKNLRVKSQADPATVDVTPLTLAVQYNIVAAAGGLGSQAAYGGIGQTYMQS